MISFKHLLFIGITAISSATLPLHGMEVLQPPATHQASGIIDADGNYSAETQFLLQRIALHLQDPQLFTQINNTLDHVAKLLLESPGNIIRRLTNVAGKPTLLPLPTDPILTQSIFKHIFTQSRRRTRLLGHYDSINAIAYHHNTIATAADDSTIVIWDVTKLNGSLETNGRIQIPIGNSLPIKSAVNFSPDGNHIVAASPNDFAANVWNTRTGNMIHHLDGPNGHDDYVYSADYSPSGNFIVTASFDKTAKIWNAQTGQHLKTLEGHTAAVNSAVYSRCGNFLATASCDETVKIWDANPRHPNFGQCLKTLAGHTNTVLCVTYAPNGNILATASADGTAKVWNTDTTQCIKTLTGHTAAVVSVAYSPCGNFLATASWDKTVKIWDVQTGRCLSTITHEDKVNAVAFSPCGNFIVTAPDIEVTIPNVNPKLSPAYIWELPWVIHPAFYKKPLRLNHILLIELIHQLGKNTPWNNELLALFKQLTSVQQAELNQRYDLKLLNTTPSSGAETTTTTTTIRSPITTSASTPTPANSPISSPATIVEHITPEERNTDEDEPKPQEKKHKSSTSTSTSDDEEEFEHKGKKGRSSKSAQLSASN